MKRKIKWFRWHLWPLNDKPIESVYEIVFLSIILAGCLYCYVRMNRVNVVDRELDVICLDNNRYERNSQTGVIQLHSYYPSAWIIYNMPMSKTLEFDNSNFNVFLGGDNEVNSAPLDYTIQKTIRMSLYEYQDSVFGAFVKEEKNKYEKTIALEEPSIKNSPAFLIRQIDVLRKNKMFYHSDGLGILDSTDTLSENQTVKKKATFVIKQDTFAIQYFISGSNLERNPSLPYIEANHYDLSYGLSEDLGLTMNTPGWFDLEDISQMYFRFKLKTSQIDSIRLKFDFVGAVDFSNMYPEPDYTTMSSIEWVAQEKINIIRQQGLEFHVHSKELENMQNVRLFFLTSLMGAIFTLLIVFIIIGIYRVLSRT